MIQPVGKDMHLLAISGSLRQGSSNTTLLRAVQQFVPPGVEIHLCELIGALPHFNPDLDLEPLPAVAAFRAQLQAADGIIFSTPEYAHGVPGVLKNALDWVVSSGELMHKPVAVIGASPNSTFARASLLETLRVIMADVVEDASITLPLPGHRTTEALITGDARFAVPLQEALQAFVAAIGQPGAEAQ